MAGHSKWANIKHKKAASDAKRGKIFTKIIRELTIAARSGSTDPNSNSRLRSAILKAKESNMPKDTMERAIKKGAGEIGSTAFEEFIYEGYGPGGVAIYMEILTDNKNRTAGDVRSLLAKMGGNLGANGCVDYMFDKKGTIIFDKKDLTEEKAMDLGIEAGAEDIIIEDKEIEIVTNPEDFETVLEVFESRNIKHQSAEVTMIPNIFQEVQTEMIEKVLQLIDKLEDNDDIQNVYTNLKLPDDYEA